ncbi:Ribosome production factor 1 [Chytriomyces hyalinus]|nr:Ribosome production factor 1 [Chytriomyces hyalinus]
MPVDPKDIRNKMKRSEVVNKLRMEKARDKLKRRMKTRKEEENNPELKEERLAANVPQTLETLREEDETLVAADDEEVFASEETDEFASYFNGTPPKILVTTSRRANPDTYEFANEFCTIFPDAQFVKRGPQFEVKKIVELAIGREYTDVIVINEDKKKPNAITVIHLPNGPTAHFKLSSVKLNKEIRGHGTVGAHKPELILNNFNTRLGHSIGRMFASLFPHVPEFKGRQVATFHNQRDFIFFRRHRYIFKDGKRCDLQELGPRFTLKLKWLQKGTFDTRYGDYEWIFKVPDLHDFLDLHHLLMHLFSSAGDGDFQETLLPKLRGQGHVRTFYNPPNKTAQEVQNLPLSQWLMLSNQWSMLPFRPLVVPLQGRSSDEVHPITTTSAFLKNSINVEDESRYANHFLRGDTLYGQNKIEYGLQAFSREHQCLVSIVRLGTGLSGHHRIGHGGFSAALLDSCFGTLFMLAAEGRYSGVTASLTVDYRAAMPVPADVCALAWIERIEGRKFYLKGELRSLPNKAEFQEPERCDDGKMQLGSGSVLYTDARALFLSIESKHIEQLRK